MNTLKTAAIVIFLLFFAAVGIAHVINPDWFIKRSGVRKGGELLTEWNRLYFELGGIAFTAFALYILYRILFSN
jgi:hypothetical protein